MSEKAVEGEIIPVQKELPVPVQVTLPANPPEEKNLISDDQMLGTFSEIQSTIKQNNSELDGLIATFSNMVINEGDSTSASKEALVNLLKIKNDNMDKMAKVADLMTRIKLKDRDTFPRYLAVNSNNKVVNKEINKKELFRELNRGKK